MNQLNRTLAPEIETVYVMASPQVSFVSSSGVKEIAVVRRKCRRARAASRRAPPPGALPERSRRDPAQRPGVGFAPMDVLVLIDKLDDLVHNAKAVPLTDQVRIDREEIYDILDQMRATIPEEIKQARWIVKERQEMLAEAKREQDRLLQEAREQAVREASQTEIVKLAERQAQEIIDEARRQAREMRLEMEDWADGMLATLESNLDRFLTAVRRGRERLHERSQETVVAGIGPIDVVDDGRRPRSLSLRRQAPDPGLRPGATPRRTCMTSFNLSPGEAPSGRGAPRGARGRAAGVRVRRPALRPRAGAGARAELVVTRATSRAPSSRSTSRRGSTARATAASATPCSRCRSARASTRPSRPTTTSCGRRTSSTGTCSTSPPGRATRSRSRCRRRSSAGPTAPASARCAART